MGQARAREALGKWRDQGRGDCAVGFLSKWYPQVQGPHTGLSHLWPCLESVLSTHLLWNKNFINHRTNATKKWTQGKCEVKHMFTTMWKTRLSAPSPSLGTPFPWHSSGNLSVASRGREGGRQHTVFFKGNKKERRTWGKERKGRNEERKEPAL